MTNSMFKEANSTASKKVFINYAIETPIGDRISLGNKAIWLDTESKNANERNIAQKLLAKVVNAKTDEEKSELINSVSVSLVITSINTSNSESNSALDDFDF